jgi:hypothetical protein
MSDKSAEAPAPDLVKRLRQPWAPSRLDHPLMTKAADEIDRLTAEVERLTAQIEMSKRVDEAFDETMTSLRADNERLRAALRFYADGGNWIGPFRAPPAVYDGGKIARAAIKEPRT